MIEVEKGSGECRPSVEWIGEAVPQKADGGLESLVVELILAPGTEQGMGGQLLKAGVRKMAREAGLKAPLDVKAIRVSPEGALAWGQISVPREDALGWLKASGAEGVTFRPFFTANTGQACRKERFALRWLKRAEIGRQKIKELWGAVRGIRESVRTGDGWSGCGHSDGSVGSGHGGVPRRPLSG